MHVKSHIYSDNSSSAFYNWQSDDWPWCVELHQDDVCIVNRLIKIVFG